MGKECLQGKLLTTKWLHSSQPEQLRSSLFIFKQFFIIKVHEQLYYWLLFLTLINTSQFKKYIVIIVKAFIAPLYTSPNTSSHPLHSFILDAECSILQALLNTESDTSCSHSIYVVWQLLTVTKLNNDRYRHTTLRTQYSNPDNSFMTQRYVFIQIPLLQECPISQSLCKEQTLTRHPFSIPLYHTSFTNISSGIQ